MQETPTVGFISPPAWLDPSPSEFPTVVEEEARTQQAPLLLPEFDYRLESIASVQRELSLCARSLKAMGCHVAAQVGSPFAWAGATGEEEARARAQAMAESAGLPVVMTGLAIIDGLRLLGVKRVAVNCTYYESRWRDAFASFLRLCGFDTVHVSTLADQGLAPSRSRMEDYGWSMTRELARRSILAVAEASPEAEAIVVTGSGTRTLKILAPLESELQRPIVAADTVLYRMIARELSLTLKPVMGSWKEI